jgi:hypothetical protein
VPARLAEENAEGQPPTNRRQIARRCQLGASPKAGDAPSAGLLLTRKTAEVGERLGLDVDIPEAGESIHLFRDVTLSGQTG